jgi:hypothetical protein
VQPGTPYARIETLIRDGGQIMIGTIAPIRGAAIAHDGKKTLVMLKHRPGEPLPDLLHRLDAAIATAKATGKRVDEINNASSDTRATNSEPVNAV